MGGPNQRRNMGLPEGMQVPNLAALQQMGLDVGNMGDLEGQQRRCASMSLALNAIANRHHLNEDGSSVHAPFTVVELTQWAQAIDDFVTGPKPTDDMTPSDSSGLVP